MSSREVNEKMFEEKIYSGSNEAVGLELKTVNDTKSIIAAVNNYLKLNYLELYSENNLDVAFKKAQENEEVKDKMFNVINNFIYN